MNLEKGKVYSGTVKNITNFGAFVDVYNEKERRDKATGMVHISEISNEYVKDIHDFLKEGQKVKVFVLGINEKNRYSFSMKKVPENSQENENSDSDDMNKADIEKNREQRKFDSKPETHTEKNDFEAMMSRFKRISEDKMCDINRIRDRRNKR